MTLVLKNLAAALFHLDRSRTPDTTRAVVGSLTEWLTQPEQDTQRRAFTACILRDLLPSSMRPILQRPPAPLPACRNGPARRTSCPSSDRSTGPDPPAPVA